MPATVSITETDVYTALRFFLVGVLATDVDVIRGQVNRVPTPNHANYCVMTSLSRERLSTNSTTYEDSDPNLPVPYSYLSESGATPGSILIATRRGSMGFRRVAHSVMIGIQLDVHGPLSADNSTMIESLFRDDYACEVFAQYGVGIQPLYCSDPRQLAFINESKQYEDRWSLDLMIQFSPVVSVPQDFADQLKIGVINVDAVYPPGAP